METDSNYTGYAKPRKDGTLEAVSSYASVGMFQPCVYVENGTAKVLTLGGFRNANGTPINKKVDVLVQNGRLAVCGRDDGGRKRAYLHQDREP